MSRGELTEYKVYGSRKKIIKHYNECKPLSGFVMRSNTKRFYIAYRHKGKIYANRVKVMYENTIHRNYMDYRQIEITNRIIIINNDDNCERMGILLLPMFPMEVDSETPLDSMENKSLAYTVVASDWNYVFE